MVVRRTVHHLRSRPPHEREAVAAWIAIVVVALLFVGWAIFFFRNLASSQYFENVPNADLGNVQSDQAAQAAATAEIMQELGFDQSASAAAASNASASSSDSVDGASPGVASSTYSPTSDTSSSLEADLRNALQP